MRLVLRIVFILFIFLLIASLYFIVQHRTSIFRSENAGQVAVKSQKKTCIYIAVVACGQKLQETLVMIKSALIFNHSKKELLHFIVFAEDHLISGFEEKLQDWRQLLPLQFEYELLSLKFPANSEIEWRNLFKPCAAQRLFLPSLLQSVDALLYVDTDINFLSPVSETWKFFKRFNDTQLAALTPEHEDENTGWYNRFARHPFYGRLGVNSGVMLMNLTRMRAFSWEKHVEKLHKEYKKKITWGDQDIINILFYYNPEKLYVMPCEFNYRPDHCMYMSVCNASVEGIKVLHGNRGYFHADKQPLFRLIYEATEKYELGTSVYRNFLLPLNEALAGRSVLESNCGKVTKESLQTAKQLFVNDYSYDS